MIENNKALSKFSLKILHVDNLIFQNAHISSVALTLGVVLLTVLLVPLVVALLISLLLGSVRDLLDLSDVDATATLRRTIAH